MRRNSKHLLVCETCDETYCMDCSDGDPSWRFCSKDCERIHLIELERKAETANSPS